MENSQKSQVALAEEKILKFWKEQNIFQKSLQKDSPQGEFVFFDGPPYATGLPHYGHLLPGTMKDVIPRYKTMKGFHVPRQWGWDCHGLPIENLIQKELNLPTKQDIVEYGIEKFNQAARASVLRYETDWKEYIPRVGRFVDMDNPYKTMDPEFMESVWAVFKNLDDQGLVYKSYKSMMVSPPLETVLSNQEVNMGGYKDITDISVYANFTLTSGPYKGVNMVAWTTTPWTLPGNVLLAVGEEIEYSVVVIGDQKYVIASKLLESSVAQKEYSIEKTFLGKDLIGSTYEPIFPIYKNHANAFRVVTGDFVTTEDGTGIVHIAPGFGQDDLNLGQKEKVKPIHHVKMDGHFVPEVENFLVEAGYDVKGWAVRNATDHQHVDVEIVKYLARNGKLFEKKKYTHSYPVCWRTDCPLINYATESWFVNVQKVKEKLIKNNQKTNWVPNHIKDGRFGKWLEEVRDWSVSRARFWGTPLPIWESESGKKLILGSIEDLRKYTKKSGNKYFVMRHGQGENNIQKIFTVDHQHNAPLTEKGKNQVKESISKFKEKVDIVICSPFERARQTAQIVCDEIGFSFDQVIFDARAQEWEVSSEFEGKERSVMVKYYHEDYAYSPFKNFRDGESFAELVKRLGNFISDIEKKYQNKTILIIGHDGMGRVLKFIAAGRTFDNLQKEGPIETLENAEIISLPFVPFPYNQNYEVDLHRPFIDNIILEKDGESYKRIPDVFDVWFDSGSMPYASHHYPFDDSRFQPKKGLFKKTKRFPADFVAEGQDQTRGWFYVMMVLASAQFDQPAFKNVLVNGLVLAEDGKKMSKRLKNYPDLNYMIDKEGADALRLFLMASPAVHAEDVNFSEKTVGEVQSKVMGRFRNSATFYEMYSAGERAHNQSQNILDKWILARLYETIRDVEEGLESYLIDKGARPLFDFVDDLSTWYVRRSRDRFKSDGEDKAAALSTTRFVLKEFAKVAAPYIPFVAEEVYQTVKEEHDPESVHLCDWPQVSSFDKNILSAMKLTRELASQGLLLRQKSGVKVRQPLQSFTITENLQREYLEIIEDELNVKEVLVAKEISLNTNLTEELKREGKYRELLRGIQDLRKKKDLSPKQTITLVVSPEAQDLVEAFSSEIKQLAQVEEFIFEDKEGEIIDLEDYKISISIR